MKINENYSRVTDKSEMLPFVALNIRFLRKEQNITQRELGDKIGATRASVMAYESAVCAPPINILISVSKYFKIDIDSLLTKDISFLQP